MVCQKRGGQVVVQEEKDQVGKDEGPGAQNFMPWRRYPGFRGTPAEEPYHGEQEYYSPSDGVSYVLSSFHRKFSDSDHLEFPALEMGQSPEAEHLYELGIIVKPCSNLFRCV